MVTILPALRQVREDLAGLLERKEVERVCHALGYTWRERQLDPYTTLHLFILQVVNQNTAMTHLPHLAGERFTPSAYCQARQRLPLALIQRLVDSFARGLEPSGTPSLWHGQRVLLVDGSGFSMPDTPGTCRVCARADRRDGLTIVSTNTPGMSLSAISTSLVSSASDSWYVSSLRCPWM